MYINERLVCVHTQSLGSPTLYICKIFIHDHEDKYERGFVLNIKILVLLSSQNMRHFVLFFFAAAEFDFDPFSIVPLRYKDPDILQILPYNIRIQFVTAKG